MAALKPDFNAQLISASYPLSASATPLLGTAFAADGDISYQWQSSPDNAAWADIPGAVSGSFVPPSDAVSLFYYRVVATNTTRGLVPSDTLAPSDTLVPATAGETAQAFSNSASITIIGASAPSFSLQPVSADYDIGNNTTVLSVDASAPHGTLAFQWQRSTDNAAFSDIPGETGKSFLPSSSAAGTVYYRAVATNTVGSSVLSSFSNSAKISVATATAPKFAAPLVSASYNQGDAATALIGTATAVHGTLSYRWQSSPDNAAWTDISGAVSAAFTPGTGTAGSFYFRVIATSRAGSSALSTTSNSADIRVLDAVAPTFKAPLTSAEYFQDAAVTALDGTATALRGSVSYKWQSSPDNTAWADISGASSATFAPSSALQSAGTIYYRVFATSTLGSSSKTSVSNSAAITVRVSSPPVFAAPLVSAIYNQGDAVSALLGGASAPFGALSYQWQSSADDLNWTELGGAVSAEFSPSTASGSTKYFRVVATNTVGGSVSRSFSNSAKIEVRVSSVPKFAAPLVSASYNCGDAVTSLLGGASAPFGTISYKWQSSPDNAAWTDIPGASAAEFLPGSSAADGGSRSFRVLAKNTVGTSVSDAVSNSATVTVFVSSAPIFTAPLVAADYYSGAVASALDGRATATRGTISYQWYSGASPASLSIIPGATSFSLVPSTGTKGTVFYKVVATDTVGTSTTSSTSNTVGILVLAATPPQFNKALSGASYDAGAAALALDGTASAPNGSVSYRWFGDGTEILGASGALFVPPTSAEGSCSYYVCAKNTVGDTEAESISNAVSVTVYFATVPTFSKAPLSASYIENGAVTALSTLAAALRGTISYRWQVSTDGLNYSDISGAVGTEFLPPSAVAGTFFYRAVATNTVGSSVASAFSEVATVKIISAEYPTFSKNLISTDYFYAQAARLLEGTATVLDGGSISYQWFRAVGKGEFLALPFETLESFRPGTLEIGNYQYYVVAKNTLEGSSRSSRSNIADIRIIDTRLSENERRDAYLEALKTDFYKLCRLDFLQPDGSIAFSLDGNPKNKRSGAFIQSGTLSVNLQNGQRRRGNILLSNLDGAFDFNVNRLWFGQRVRLMMGLRLPDGSDYYIPQGIFYLSNPRENFFPDTRTAEYDLLDKWAYLDGTLFGNLDGIYETALNENIFTAIESILLFDRGNGEPVDSVPPIFTEYYRGKTVTLPNGTTVPVTNTPYTYRCDSISGTYADIILEMNTMLAGIIGYDRMGQLRLDTSDEDVLDTAKPVLWSFSPTEKQFLGASYTIRDTDLFNDIIVEGGSLDNSACAKGRATNMDARSDTNIFGRLGRRTKRMSAPKYYADAQCRELAEWYLKRQTVLKKAVSISSTQMFHLNENCLVNIRRPDKNGLIERHLITGFTLPLGQGGEMGITATSVNDFFEATVM